MKIKYPRLRKIPNGYYLAGNRYTVQQSSSLICAMCKEMQPFLTFQDGGQYNRRRIFICKECLPLFIFLKAIAFTPEDCFPY